MQAVSLSDSILPEFLLRISFLDRDGILKDVSFQSTVSTVYETSFQTRRTLLALHGPLDPLPCSPSSKRADVSPHKMLTWPSSLLPLLAQSLLLLKTGDEFFSSRFMTSCIGSDKETAYGARDGEANGIKVIELDCWRREGLQHQDFLSSSLVAPTTTTTTPIPTLHSFARLVPHVKSLRVEGTDRWMPGDRRAGDETANSLNQAILAVERRKKKALYEKSVLFSSNESSACTRLDCNRSLVPLTMTVPSLALTSIQMEDVDRSSSWT